MLEGRYLFNHLRNSYVHNSNNVCIFHVMYVCMYVMYALLITVYCLLLFFYFKNA